MIKKANSWTLLSMEHDKSFDNSDASSLSDHETSNSDSESVLSDAEANDMTVSSQL